MKLSRTVLAVLAAGALVFAACGGDDSDDSSSESDTTTTTAAETTTTTAAEADTTELTGEEAAAAEVVATLFDSSVAFDEKIALVEGGEAHRATHDAYVVAADAVGGITVEPTAVDIAGDTATVTYNLSFAGTPQYEGLTKDLTRSGDSWVMSTAEFCGFTAQAGAACA
jgi:hypothetical protein